MADYSYVEASQVRPLVKTNHTALDLEDHFEED